ncbi:MAG: SDR family NAD(P)-dependent oxidoreductase [Crenarchaeota archaeon]|nr:MAG: SDR family NAD(P)-dependent oxidoreductase [Thermoproteota archaeon]RDJ33304.1 MAG: SDR family NAD(P)-dependent oxidoreductase [Thermoproteota archaeon]RDJ36193.1 MAG: SDR family NAD(P)-dependent oxidoreductase [Thermoproteota archaeon]RDJ38824.1 MAG: SDR family NAD(P)-dependent oxidoreductase [Thermoproteota archaeon]
MSKAIVFGGSRGIGKAIANSLNELGFDVIATSKKHVDTSDISSIKNFITSNNETDILVLNTGGPPAKEFYSITQEEWEKFHRQLFLGFCIILQDIKVNNGGYIFLISSNVIKEPNSKLIMSSAYRTAFTSVFKILSKEFAARGISCINIAPGPINTDRTRELIDDVEKYSESLPMKRLGDPKEIGNFVKSIVEKKIKYLSGTTINFDGANSNYIF